MATATETFAVGAEQFTVAVEIDLNAVWLISGDFSGTIPNGQIGFINGDVNLTGDLIVEGLLTGIDTFTLTGNGFQILMQNGGQLNLQGVEKTAWMRWGDSPTNWQTGDRVAVAPTATGVFAPSEILWGAARPTNSPDVTLIDGSIAKPEVVNLTQTIVLVSLRRIHFHDGAGVQTLKWLKVLNSGTTGVLAEYPIHFHLNGESSRGSVVEGVVVEGGKNHAFVPHASHGITFRDCVAYNTINDAFWWDPPPSGNDPINNSHDILYDHCLAGKVNSAPGQGVSAFFLGRGDRNICVDSAAYGVQGLAKSSGFHWPEGAGAVWNFERDVSHNNKSLGIFVWQNTVLAHDITDFVAYRNGKAQVEHGAYTNGYQYRRMVLMGGTASIKLHARSRSDRILLFEDVIADSPLEITKHQASSDTFAVFRRCLFPEVVYTETFDNGHEFSWIKYEDCGLVPADFDLAGAFTGTIVEIYEAGVLVHRWTNGSWT